MNALRKFIRAICAVCHCRELADALKRNATAIDRLHRTIRLNQRTHV